MIWIQFLATAIVIVFAGVRLARYGDVLGEKTGLGRSWVGVVLLAATTSLPELFTGFGATALADLPDIAVGDVLGSCMFNLVILSMMDAVQPEPLSTRAHQGHALSIGFGLLLIGIAGLGLLGSSRLPAIGWIGLYTPALIAVYFVSMRLIFTHEQHRRLRESQEVAEELQYAEIPLRKRCFLQTATGRLMFDVASDVGIAKDVPIEAHRRFRADLQTRNPMSIAEQDVEPFAEKHYTINELAAMWRLSGEFVRQLVQHEPGMTEWVRQRPGRRRYPNESGGAISAIWKIAKCDAALRGSQDGGPTRRDYPIPVRSDHRDGWLFQVMSWLAAHTATPGGLISPPHMIQAHKGFDGLQLELSADGMRVSAAIVFEDKATENPRDTIRDEVWPEITQLEAGVRDNVLIAELNSLLRMRPQINADDVIRNIVWRELRHYRIGVLWMQQVRVSRPLFSCRLGGGWATAEEPITAAGDG